jgi:hypothetical protein
MDASASPAGEWPIDEHVGPLLLSRHRKSDGRALLLFRRVSDAGETAATAAAPDSPSGGS